jgi:hypothetical protein
MSYSSKVAQPCGNGRYKEKMVTSTMESKHNALSLSMQEVLPLLLLTKIIANA